MSALTAPSPTTRTPAGLRRAGYLITIVVNAVMLWVAHQLLPWGWPDFLTADFEQVLPVVTASIVATIVVNAVLLADDRRGLAAFGDVITSAFALAVLFRLWSVFPFDFTAYHRDWSDVARLVIGLGIFGTSVGAIVGLVKLLTADRS